MRMCRPKYANDMKRKKETNGDANKSTGDETKKFFFLKEKNKNSIFMFCFVYCRRGIKRPLLRSLFFLLQSSVWLNEKLCYFVMRIAFSSIRINA